MKRLNVLAVLLLILSVLLGSCGHGDSSSVPYYYPGYSGDFLSWTGGSDASHFFTLVRVNGRTGAVANIGGFDYFPAMAYALDGTLYGISRELHKINPADGSTVTVGSLDYGLETGILMHGAAFSPDGTLYVVENAVGAFDRVFTVNLSNAALTLVGTPTASIWDLEFASNGTLYGAFGSLYALNPIDTSTVSIMGNTGTYLLPLTFDSGGTLFGLDDQSTKIYSLNLLNGWAAPVIKTGSDGLTSLVVEIPPAIPAGVLFNKAVASHGYSSSKPLENLMSMERAIKSARRMMK